MDMVRKGGSSPVESQESTSALSFECISKDTSEAGENEKLVSFSNRDDNSTTIAHRVRAVERLGVDIHSLFGHTFAKEA